MVESDTNFGRSRHEGSQSSGDDGDIGVIATGSTAGGPSPAVPSATEAPCTFPECDGGSKTLRCFVCDARVCSTHVQSVRVVARLGSVEPVPVCCSCIVDRNVWRADSTAQSCHDCCKAFTFFRRRHHCRVCGHIFCDTCSKWRRNVPVQHPKHREVNVRVCLPCSDTIDRTGEFDGAREVYDSAVCGGSRRVVETSEYDMLLAARRPTGDSDARELGGDPGVPGTADSDIFERFMQMRDAASKSQLGTVTITESATRDYFDTDPAQESPATGPVVAPTDPRLWHDG